MKKRKLLTAGQAAEYLGCTDKQFRRIQDQIPLAKPRMATANGKLGWRYYWQHDIDRWVIEMKKAAKADCPTSKPTELERDDLIQLDDCPDVEMIENSKLF